jgi:hypothetical protein
MPSLLVAAVVVAAEQAMRMVAVAAVAQVVK